MTKASTSDFPIHEPLRQEEISRALYFAPTVNATIAIPLVSRRKIDFSNFRVHFPSCSRQREMVYTSDNRESHIHMYTPMIQGDLYEGDSALCANDLARTLRAKTEETARYVEKRRADAQARLLISSSTIGTNGADGITAVESHRPSMLREAALGDHEGQRGNANAKSDDGTRTRSRACGRIVSPPHLAAQHA